MDDECTIGTSINTKKINAECIVYRKTGAASISLEMDSFNLISDGEKRIIASLMFDLSPW